MREDINVFVAGTPSPQGSKRYLGKGRFVEVSPKLDSWRNDIRCALLDGEGKPKMLFAPGVEIRAYLEFILPRPKSASRKKYIPASKRPDLDKLVRAVFDAIKSAGVIQDDSQIVKLDTSKTIAKADNEVTGVGIYLTEYQWG